VESEAHLLWRRVAAPTADGPGVELARAAEGILVRAAGDPDGARLSFTPAEIAAFLDGAKAGEFDDLVSSGS
jgi:hypothetical protein